MVKLTEAQNMKMQKKVDKLIALKNDREQEMTIYESETVVSIAKQLRAGYKLSINQASFVATVYKRLTTSPKHRKNLGKVVAGLRGGVS